MNEAQTRESLNLRVPSDLKHRVQEYARSRGLSINAATIVLLDERLTEWEGTRK